MVHVDWFVKDVSVKVIKDNGTEMILCVGEYISCEGRAQGIRIEKFAGDEGPIGFEYLPWRGTRWATPALSLRGNPRFIICLPHGLTKYGQHIDWSTVQHLNDGVSPDVL